MAKVVTITNPVTGQPAQVDQLDHTAQQIDDAVAAARWSHRNLLDNAYWANADAIIDQRQGWVVPPGTVLYSNTALTVENSTAPIYLKVSYVNETYGLYINAKGNSFYVKRSDMVRGYVGAGYGIDRWKVSSGSSQYSVVLINDDSISLQFTPGTSGSQFVQISEIIDLDLTGFTVTISVLTKDNELLTATGVLSTNYFAAGDLSKFYAAVLMTGGRISFSIVNKLSTAKSFRAAKLELGDKQTLAHQDEDGNWVLNDPPPDKGMELAKCQRYCFVWDYGNTSTSCLAVFQAYTATNAFGIIPTPVTLRASPVVSGGTLVAGGKIVTLSSIVKCANGVRAIASVSNGDLTVGQAVGIENGNDNDRVVFSADL